jgi:hypothetical protein
MGLSIIWKREPAQTLAISIDLAEPLDVYLLSPHPRFTRSGTSALSPCVPHDRLGFIPSSTVPFGLSITNTLSSHLFRQLYHQPNPSRPYDVLVGYGLLPISAYPISTLGINLDHN